MSPTYDVAVIGGGIVGCAIAAELAGRGAGVLLLERERISCGASSAAAGMLAAQSEAYAPDAWFDLLLRARAEHEPLARLLREETGVDVGYRREGVLRVAVTEGDRPELRHRAAWQRAAGLAAEWLEPDNACRLEPELSRDISGALWCPDEAQVHSPRLTQALGLLAVRRGAVLQEGAAVSRLELAGNRVVAVQAQSQRWAVGAVVLAAGVWSAGVEGPAAKLPLEPVKGQIVAARLGPGCMPRRIVWGADAYLVPKASGELLVGATEEPSFDTQPTLGAISGLVNAGSRLIPGLASMPLSSAWAGLRPALPDRRPVLGPIRDVEGLFVAVGHYRNGILLGPITGRLMADLVLGQPTDVDVTPYSPDRFTRELVPA